MCGRKRMATHRQDITTIPYQLQTTIDHVVDNVEGYAGKFLMIHIRNGREEGALVSKEKKTT
jgi:hypothetical protein